MTSDLERVGREAGVYFTARDLMTRTFPEPRWPFPALLPKGSTCSLAPPSSASHGSASASP
jgi:hypothetical protein